MIAEVVFDIPLERSFHYLVPPELEPKVQRGMRVLAPFGRRERLGFIVSLPQRSPVRELKAIRRVVDPIPVIADERWELASWCAEHYCCSLGEAFAAMVPSQLRLGEQARRPRSEAIAEGGEDGSVAPRLTTDSGESPAERGRTPLLLSASQQEGLKVIIDALDARRGETILVHGVTGSGKTELYLHAIDRVMRQGCSAICLVPEIALTPQTIDRFQARFGEEVAVWHSRLRQRERAATWSRLAEGARRIVIGARSAIFAPVQRLGLVILDEEHERTYKQDHAPYFHARELARQRARLAGATVVLGSATPSIESYYAATRGPWRLVRLPQRVKGQSLPKVELIDLRQEWLGGRRGGPLSGPLQQALQQTAQRGEQAMLLLNRRGFSRTVTCQACGTVIRCGQCSIPLIYHAGQRALVCHYCNFQMPTPERCPSCQKSHLRFRGSGTERVESELHRLFPMASIARMDRDTTRNRESYRRIYEAVRGEQVGLLVGTQMIAKGLDFPQVTLVGVVSADTALNLPDFRAGEWTFDLLTQIAGRAGRGEQPGRVLIQTYCPTHYAIQAAREHDYGRFYREEIAMRRRLSLPPFASLIEVTLRGSSQERVFNAAHALAGAVREAAGRQRITLLGPAPHRIPRLRRIYRVTLLLKGRAPQPMAALVRGVIEPGRRFRGVSVAVNVDPL